MRTQSKIAWKSVVGPLLGAAGVGLLLTLLFAPAGDGGLPEGTPAPAFEMTDLSGRKTTLEEYRGRVVLLDFWATWCTSCLQEVPGLKALHEAYPSDRFALLAASLDHAGPEVVAEYAAEFKLPYRVLFAQAATGEKYGVIGLPTKFLIDQEGRIYRTYLPDAPHAQIESDIITLLERNKS